MKKQTGSRVGGQCRRKGTTGERRVSSLFIYVSELSLIFFLVLLTSLAAQSLDSRQYLPPGELVDVGGRRLHLNCTGQGDPTVVIIPATFSFDWNLVQPEASKFARTCTYDRAGFAWSDPGPKATCRQRVEELHSLLRAAGVKSPYVLVGHSISAAIARLYADQFPADVVGMVLVDHMGFLRKVTPEALQGPVPPLLPELPAMPAIKPASLQPVQPEEAYTKLPPKTYALYLAALANQNFSRPEPTAPTMSREDMNACFAQVNATAEASQQPLGDRPVVVLTRGDFGQPEAAAQWKRMQATLLSLSRNSVQVVAEKSGHLIHLHQPELGIDAIRAVVEAVRNHSKLNTTGEK